MHIMPTAITLVAASCMLFSASQFACAAGTGEQADPALAGLASTAVPTTQLRTMRGGALVVSSSNAGVDTGNSANNSPTGAIMDNQSINNNTGITTIFQNTGNNALMQSSTTVNISLY